MRNDSITRDELLIFCHKAALYSERTDSDDTPIGDKPGQIFVIARIWKDGKTGSSPASDRTRKIDPARLGPRNCFATGAAGVVLHNASELNDHGIGNAYIEICMSRWT